MNWIKYLIGLGLTALLFLGCARPQAPRMATVEGDEIDVASKIPGRIERVAVKLGDRVKKGDLLAVLTGPEVTARVEQAKAGLAAAQAQLDMARSGVRKEEREMAERQLEIARCNLDMVERMYRRVLRVFEEGGVSAQEKELAEFRYQIAREQHETARSFMDMVRNGARKEQIQQLEAQVRAMGEKVNEAIAYLNELEIRAPLDGEIRQVNAQVGEIVTPGFPVISMLDADRYLVFNLRENDFAGLKVGDTRGVFIPALELKARMTVYHIAAMADFARYEATSERGSWDVRSFEVRARLTEPLAALRPGMSVRIDE
jgi:HlyD family secretion protein